MFNINYEMNTFEYSGDEIKEIKAVRQTHESETDDLHYAFIDLTEKHRMDNLMGIKILSINPK